MNFPNSRPAPLAKSRVGQGNHEPFSHSLNFLPNSNPRQPFVFFKLQSGVPIAPFSGVTHYPQ